MGEKKAPVSFVSAKKRGFFWQLLILFLYFFFFWGGGRLLNSLSLNKNVFLNKRGLPVGPKLSSPLQPVGDGILFGRFVKPQIFFRFS